METIKERIDELNNAYAILCDLQKKVDFMQQMHIRNEYLANNAESILTSTANEMVTMHNVIEDRVTEIKKTLDINEQKAKTMMTVIPETSNVSVVDTVKMVESLTAKTTNVNRTVTLSVLSSDPMTNRALFDVAAYDRCPSFIILQQLLVLSTDNRSVTPELCFDPEHCLFVCIASKMRVTLRAKRMTVNVRRDSVKKDEVVSLDGVATMTLLTGEAFFIHVNPQSGTSMIIDLLRLE